jgi:hypothetical protein
MVADVKEALALVEKGDPPVILLITNSPEPFERLIGIVHLLYLASAPDWELALRSSRMHVLQKPFDARDLVEAVGAIVPGKVTPA